MKPRPYPKTADKPNFVGGYLRHATCKTIARPTDKGEWCPHCKRFLKDEEMENVEIK